MTQLITNINKIFNKKFVRSVLVVASGTAFAQGLMVVFSPLITRIYGPDIFGVLGVFTSIANIIIPISAITLPMAIVLPNDDKKGEDIARLSLKATFFMTLIFLFLILIGGNELLRVLNAEVIGSFIYFLPFIILFSGIIQVNQQRLFRVKEFKVGAKIQVIKTFFMNLAQVSIGLIIPHSLVLVLSTIIGYGLEAILLLKAQPISIKKRFELNIFKLSIKEKNILKEYKDFPMYRMPQIFINSFSNSLPIMLLSIYFGPAPVGFYTIGKKVLGLPSQLIGQAIGDVFYPHASSVANSKNQIQPLLIKSTVSLALLGIIPFGVVVLFGPQLFSFVFGQEWEIAGVYAQWLSLWSFFVFINRPSIRVLPIINAQKFFLQFEILGTILKSGSIILGAAIFDSDLLAISLFSIANVFLNILLIVFTIYRTKKFDKSNSLSLI